MNKAFLVLLLALPLPAIAQSDATLRASSSTLWATRNLTQNTNLLSMTNGQVLMMVGTNIIGTNAPMGTFDTNQAVMSITNLTGAQATLADLTVTGTGTYSALNVGDMVLTNGSGIGGLPYDATWAGAIANDGLDDTIALQTAVNNAATLGKPVWLPKGTFNLGAGSYTINITGNTTIIGNGPDTVIRHFGRGSSTAIFTVTTGGNLTLKNVKLENARIGVYLPEAYIPTFAAPRTVNILLEDIWTDDCNSVLWGSGSTANFDTYDWVDSVIVRRVRFLGDNTELQSQTCILWDRIPTHLFLVEECTMDGGHTFIYNRFDDIPKTNEDNPTKRNGVAVVRHNEVRRTGSYVYHHQAVEMHGNEILIERNKFDQGAMLAGYNPTIAGVVDGGSGYVNGTAYLDGPFNTNVVLTLTTSAGAVTAVALNSLSYAVTNTGPTNVFIVIQGANTNATISVTGYTTKSLEQDAVYIYGRNARIRGNFFDRWGNVVQKYKTITLKGASLVVDQSDTNTIQASVNFNHPPGWGAIIEDNTFQDDLANPTCCGQIGTDVDGLTVRNNVFLDFGDANATHIIRISPSTATYNELGFFFVENNWFMRCRPLSYATYSSDTTGTVPFCNIRFVGNRILFDKRASSTGYAFDAPWVTKNFTYSDNVIWDAPLVCAFRAVLSTTNRSMTFAMFERNYFTNISDGLYFVGPASPPGGSVTNLISRNNLFEKVNRAHYFQQNINVTDAAIHDNTYRTVTTPIHKGISGVNYNNFRYMSNGFWYSMGTNGTIISMLSPPFYGVTTTTPTEGLVAGGSFLSNDVRYVYNGSAFITGAP